jgi:hypothetical protein
VVALAATISGDGIVAIPGVGQANAMAVATINVGTFDTITAKANTGGVNLPLVIGLCQSDPLTAACVNPTVPAAEAVMGMAPNQTATFSLFVTATGAVPFDPANHRIFITFEDAGGVVRGSTSVAVTTE